MNGHDDHDHDGPHLGPLVRIATAGVLGAAAVQGEQERAEQVAIMQQQMRNQWAQRQAEIAAQQEAAAIVAANAVNTRQTMATQANAHLEQANALLAALNMPAIVAPIIDHISQASALVTGLAT